MAIDSIVPELEKVFKEYGVSKASLESFDSNLNQYQAAFSEVVQLQQEIGLTPKTGLYGTLRTAVHNVETLLKQYNQLELEVAMLQLRRNEKILCCVES